MRALTKLPSKPKFKVPYFPCGDYQDPKTGRLYSFRYRPRALRHAGKFGFYAHDKDAGKVLAAVGHRPDGDQWLWETVEPGYLPEDIYEFIRGLTPTQRACAMCGKKAAEGEWLHPNCGKKLLCPIDITDPPS